MRKADAEALMGLLNEAFPGATDGVVNPGRRKNGDGGAWELEIAWPKRNEISTIYVDPSRLAWIRLRGNLGAATRVAAPISGRGWREAFVKEIKGTIDGGK